MDPILPFDCNHPVTHQIGYLKALFNSINILQLCRVYPKRRLYNVFRNSIFHQFCTKLYPTEHLTAATQPLRNGGKPKWRSISTECPRLLQGFWPLSQTDLYTMRQLVKSKTPLDDSERLQVYTKSTTGTA